MHESHDRREFLNGLVGSGVAMAGAGLLSSCAMASTGLGANSSSSVAAWDMSWTRRLRRYKTAYDSPEIYEGAALSYAEAAAAGYKAAYNAADAEFTPVIIFRHAAAVMALNDAMWSRLALGETNKLKDPTTGEPNTKRNPFLTFKKGDKDSLTGPGGSIEALLVRGAIILACNNALGGVAARLREKEPTAFDSHKAAMAAVRSSVIPGAYVMPNGIFAVSAAQDAGCHYMRVIG